MAQGKGAAPAVPAVAAYKRGREFKVILPPDISEWIEREAREEGRPQSRIIINHLSRVPYLDRQAKLGELIRDMETTLAKYGSRITQIELNEALLRALDEALAAGSEAQRQPPLDRLRVIRRAMLETERKVAQGEREQLTARVEQLERQIAAIEALPASALDKDNLPSLKDELARMQRLAAGE
jgi:hypothetical protein